MAFPKRTFAVAAGANANAVTGAGGLYGITVRDTTGVAAAGTLTIYDNTAASGPVLAVIRMGADGEQHFVWDKGVKFGTGLHVAAAGADLSGSLLVGGSGGLRALPFAGADLQLSAVPRIVDSILVAETAGAVAEWRLFDALTATGTAFVGASHVADRTAKFDWPDGIRADVGLFFDQVAGATSGAVYVQ